MSDRTQLSALRCFIISSSAATCFGLFRPSSGYLGDGVLKHRKVESCVLTDKPTLQQSNWNTTVNGIHKCKDCISLYCPYMSTVHINPFAPSDSHSTTESQCTFLYPGRLRPGGGEREATIFFTGALTRSRGLCLHVTRRETDYKWVHKITTAIHTILSPHLNFELRLSDYLLI
jgi:hypothetical protein